MAVYQSRHMTALAHRVVRPTVLWIDLRHARQIQPAQWSSTLRDDAAVVALDYRLRVSRPPDVSSLDPLTGKRRKHFAQVRQRVFQQLLVGEPIELGCFGEILGEVHDVSAAVRAG